MLARSFLYRLPTLLPLRTMPPGNGRMTPGTVRTAAAAEAAVAAIHQVPGVILPFPGGIVRSGSKVGSRYKKLRASTNDPYCPTLRGLVQTALPEGVTPDDLVVHQQDLQAVVNALLAGGAQGVEVMDQRLVSTSAVRCVGNTLLLHGRVYSPPFTVSAVGDVRRMDAALQSSPQVTTYREWVDAVGLGYQVSQRASLDLPGYTGDLDLVHAQAVS